MRSFATEMKYFSRGRKTDAGYSAYSPDIDGCIATGETRNEVEKNMKEAIEISLGRISNGKAGNTGTTQLPKLS